METRQLHLRHSVDEWVTTWAGLGRHARHSILVIVVNIYLAVSRLLQGRATMAGRRAICPSHPTPRPGMAAADTRSLTGRHLRALISMGILIDRPVTNNKLYPVLDTALITSSQLSPH